MRGAPAGQPHRAVWRVGFWAATLLGVLYAVQQVGLNLARDRPADALGSLAQQLVPWYVWAAALPLVLRLCERYPLRGERTAARLLRYAGFGVVAAVAHAAVTLLPLHLLLGWAAEGQPLWMSYQFLFVNRSVEAFVHFGLLAAGCHAFLSQRAARERELAAARLTAELSEARLRALQGQLEPHFLFNTLNAIAAHIRDEPEVAESMVEQLSALLRMLLQRRDEAEVPLEREMAFVRSYLAIHQVRFGERLDLRFHVEEGAEQAYVPALLLQPLAENAIVHGVAAHPGRARVQIGAARRAGRLHLQVSNEAPGGDGRAAPREGGGVGLANTRARLSQLYGAEHRLEVRQAPGGTVVEVEIPLHFAPLTGGPR
jgi:two-component system, LytTR family, sensor kinase